MKYIPADKLIAEIRNLRSESCISESDEYYEFAKSEIIDIITSLQQEQPEVQNGKFAFPKYLYARTKDNKTIDMSYAPQDMTAVEYIRNDFVEQEQPEVDFDREIDLSIRLMPGVHRLEDNEQWYKGRYENIKELVHQYYELGLKARKEE